MATTRQLCDRVGVIDVGSNSVRLVVFDGAARSPAYFFNEKVLCGLGRGLAESGRLSPEGRVRAHAAIKRFALLLEHMEVSRLETVATAAVREASDGADFCAGVLADTGIALRVASGEEEARLSAQGVLLGWPGAEGVVCDIGGASMELALLAGGQVGTRTSTPLGPLKLAGRQGDLAAHIDTVLAEAMERADIPQGETLFLVGGSWRALARIDMARRNYPLHVLHEYALTSVEMGETAAWVSRQSPEVLSALGETSMARLRLVPLAAEVMGGVLARLRPSRIAFSSYGIREGLLYEAMPSAMRQLDPMIEACRYMEVSNARFPGFGDALFRWLKGLFAGEDMRLVLAACLLHDTTWRAHPDYRADMCFETVTRANMGGIDHQGRLFLAWAIRSRYKAGGADAGATLALLPEARANVARSLGLAMRLGAMISGAQAVMLEDTELTLENGILTLSLPGRSRALMGEVLEKRFQALARGLDAEPYLQLQ
ncbi:MAG: Ppx/GppA family phosphatase [Rhodobacteraceae bacterium]|nr:Ppx/GppA family phosphatase [Paracoccaceae bacterium]